MYLNGSSLNRLGLWLFLLQYCLTHQLAQQLVHQLVLVLDLLQHLLLFHLVLAGALALQPGVYLLGLLEKLGEKFRQLGDAVEGLGYLVNHSHVLFCVLFSA